MDIKYAVDEIIDNIVILENIETYEKMEIVRESIPFPIQEGNILCLHNNHYSLDLEEEQKRRQLLREKLNQLRRKEH